MHFKVVSVENYTEEYKDLGSVRFTSDFEEHDLEEATGNMDDEEY